MLKKLFLSCALFASSCTGEFAHAEPAARTGTVLISGLRYHTGLLRKPAGESGGAIFYAPSTDILAQLPESYDARDYGLVSPIKDQGQCGSCWAFSRTKSFEAALRKVGNPLNLAEQDTLVNDKSAYGCDGGFMDGKFETTQGQTTEDLCPYKANDRVACIGAKAAKATKWAMIGASNRSPTDDELKAAIYQHGVISVTVAAGSSFSPNREGRITSCGSRGINHMVTLAGYRPAPGGGVEFLIGNSWGTGWGLEGFAWSKRGCNQLASTAGDAALFFYVEGETPDPTPAKIELPLEVIITNGHEVALQVRPQQGYTYKWSNGADGPIVWVRPTESTSYTLTAKGQDGSQTSQVIKVTLK